MRFSPQELDYLRSAFIRSVAESASGTYIVAGSLPPDRLSGPVPPDLLEEADPVALPVAQEALSAVQALSGSTIPAVAVDIAGNTSSIATLQAQLAVVDASVTALEARVSTLESTVSSLFDDGLTVAELVVRLDDGSDTTLTFTNGLLTANVPVVP